MIEYVCSGGRYTNWEAAAEHELDHNAKVQIEIEEKFRKEWGEAVFNWARRHHDFWSVWGFAHEQVTQAVLSNYIDIMEEEEE